MHPLKEYMGELSDDSSESHQGPSSVLVKEQPGEGRKVKKRKKLLPRGKNMVEGWPSEEENGNLKLTWSNNVWRSIKVSPQRTLA